VTPEWPILAAIADAQPVDFSAMAAAQQPPHCRSQPRQSATPRCSGTSRRGCSARWYRSNTGRRFSSHCTLYTTRGCGRSAASSRLSSAGHRWPRQLPRWPGPACSASGAKFTDTYTYNRQRFLYLTAVSPTSTWTWSGRCRLRAATPTCSLSSTGRRGGQRPSRSPPSPPPTAPGPSSPGGCPASEYQPPSLQTEGPNSRPPFGRACAACSTSSTHPRQLNTLSPTGWSSGSTGG
jgi:hypothetical protein